ncbi:hypothetical protein [Pseudonocardia pini]|uniref:hypothetical protein n=1 Tax=Pseudonocardia pini TaxID=2758030 RepID=UPI0015F0798F|nr:hypothetical protein [Pseudonocardia pini]
MTYDATFLHTLVDERRGALLAEADTARLARIARRWQRAMRRSPSPEPPPRYSPSTAPGAAEPVGASAPQCRVPAAR